MTLIAQLESTRFSSVLFTQVHKDDNQDCVTLEAYVVQLKQYH